MIVRISSDECGISLCVLAVWLNIFISKRQTDQTAESEPETAEREQTEETEIIEAALGTRKEYMDRLSEQGWQNIWLMNTRAIGC